MSSNPIPTAIPMFPVIPVAGNAEGLAVCVGISVIAVPPVPAVGARVGVCLLYTSTPKALQVSIGT